MEQGQAIFEISYILQSFRKPWKKMKNHFQFECHPGQLVEQAGFLISFQRLVGLIRPLTVSFFRPVFRYFVPTLFLLSRTSTVTHSRVIVVIIIRRGPLDP